MNAETKSTSAVALVTGGIASAFALAACCALPVLLAGAGLSAYWLAPIATFADPRRGLLTALAVVALAGSVVVVLSAPPTCSPGDLCARPAFRVTIVMVAIIGAVLLILSRMYA
jgi:mercuric ion transport protein